MSDPGPSTGRVPVRLFVVIGLAGLLTMFAVAYTLKASLGGASEVTFPIVDDYLRAPQTVPERVAIISAQVRRIQVSHSGIEAYDVDGQRYSISPDGTHLSRGGEADVPAQSFAVADIDFTKLPTILNAAAERSSATVNSATVEVIDGAPMWRVSVWADGGTRELLYTLTGELRPGANAQ